MGRFTVYSKDGQTVRCVLDKLEYTGVFMAERACTSTFISDVKINFDVFDYIDYRGERFELELLPTVKKISKHQYSYDLNFVSLKYELERCMMRNIVPSDNGIVYPTPLVVEFTGTVKYLAERIQACLDAMYGKGVWSITLADGVDSEEKNISMSNQNCWSALSLVNTEYKLNYFVKGRSVTIGGAEPVVNNVFEYGKGKGLYEIERISDADTGIVTKLRAYGGTRNLDYSYPKKPEWTDSILPANYALSPLRLMLPSFKTDGVTDFVLASNEAIAKYGIREGVITYDDIYPSITGMKNSAGQAIDEIKSVDAITSETQPTFTVQLYDLGFDLNESYMPEAQLSMKSGALQGYAFTITKIVKASDGSYTLTLGRNTLEEADTDNFTVPNKDWNMKAGDKFVLLNILMPQEYIRAAENRLLERAKEYLAKYSSTNYSYNIGVDEIFMARNANFYNEIMEGKRLTVNDPEMGIDHENVIIQSLSIKEGEGLIPTFEVTLNNEPSASTLERIQGQISEIETSVNNKFSSQSELSKQYRKKLDKVVWDRNLEERVDDNGEEYLFLTKPLITAYGVTMYAGADVQVPSIYEGLPIDGVTIQWVDGKLVATGGKGTANGIVVNGNTYTPNEDGIITLPNYPSLSGYATEQWVNNTLSGYATSSSLSQLSAKVDNFLEGTDTDGIINKWKELESFLAGQTQTSTLAELLSVKADKATTLAGYGITDAYTKNDISGLLADYVTKSGAQDITGIKSFINGLNIGDILVKKHSDGVVELDGDLILTGSLTMFAQGSHTASTILDALPIDNTTLSKEGGVLSVIGGVGGGSVDGIILNGTTYSPDETTKLITLPNYPTTLPASDVYSWAKQPNKPSYSFGELSSHPTTLGGYGITDAYTKSDADGKYVLKAGDTVTGDLSVAGQLFAGNEQFVATLLYTFIGRDKGIYFSNDANNGSLYVNTHYDRSHQAGSFIINEANGVVTFQNNPTVKSNTILHTGNYAGELDNRYVNKAGDTMTGKLLFNADSGIDLISIPRTKSAISFNNAGSNRIGINFTDGDGNLRIARTDINQDWASGDVNILLGSNNYKVWHAGNDGSGSGLDADLLDGYHESDFVRSWWTDSPGYNCSTHNIRPLISFTYRNSAPFSGGFIDVSTNGYGFYLGTGYSSDQSLYYRRHGGPSDGGMGSWQQLARVTDNIASATKLQTPRSLWGQTFDGTGNVNGTIHVNSGGIYPIILRNSGGSECSIDYQCSGEHFVAGVYPDRFFIWRENGGEIASFLSNGNVGIGSLSTSGKKLYVNGDVGVAGTIYLETLSGGNERDLLYQQIADNDLFRIRCGGPSNQGWVEIATADDGTEPIYVRQYTGKFASITRTLTLLDGSGNTICPGNLLTYGGITMYSDLRKKNVLNSIIVPLDVMANADLFDYTFKTDEKCKVRAGTSAQYWNVFLPQVTDTDNEGFFTMSYDVLATTCVLSMAKHFQRFLIEDFGRHETEIERLKRENEELKNRVIELERRAA